MKNINALIVFFLLAIFSAFGQDGWTTVDLTTWKMGIGSAQVGSKVFFGGGLTSEGVTDMVEIYDINTKDWIYGNLAVARNFPAAVSNGNLIFFAGGMDNFSSAFNTVDMFDMSTHEWSLAQLSQAGFNLSAVSKGNKVLFAGGGDLSLGTESDVVDIYNSDTREWTTAFLSEARAAMGSAVVGDIALFAGGLLFSTKAASEKVDIYNFSTGSWSMARLSIPRFGIAATTIGDKVFFAGGEYADGTLSNRVDIYDNVSKTWSIDSISVARVSAGAATVCNKAYFIGGMKVSPATYQIIGDFDVIDVYDDATGEWSVEHLPYNLFGHSTISAGNQIFIAGGGTIIGDMIQLRDVIRIFTCTTVATEDLGSQANLMAYPNPTSGSLYLTFQDNVENVKVIITDITGKGIYVASGSNAKEIEINTTGFAEGVYVVQIQTPQGIQSRKIVVAR
ncbi:MAG: T9SS type A sorting domain-containing protein [Saprospiraceae bacterium]|nr:T9SS type A sorting domain-containing protein [Candidatus Opimibacter iunctus]